MNVSCKVTVISSHPEEPTPDALPPLAPLRSLPFTAELLRGGVSVNSRFSPLLSLELAPTRSSSSIIPRSQCPPLPTSRSFLRPPFSWALGSMWGVGHPAPQCTPSLGYSDATGLAVLPFLWPFFLHCFAGSIPSPQTPGVAEPRTQTLAFLFSVQSHSHITSSGIRISNTISMLLIPKCVCPTQTSFLTSRPIKQTACSFSPLEWPLEGAGQPKLRY